METIYHYKVSIYKNTQPLSRWDIDRKDEFINEVVEIACQNSRYIVIKDWYFTKLCIEKNDYDSCLDKVSLYARTRDNILGNGIFYNVYTNKPKTAKKIRSEIEAFIKKEFGWLGQGIDLSIIK